MPAIRKMRGHFFRWRDSNFSCQSASYCSVRFAYKRLTGTS